MYPDFSIWIWVIIFHGLMAGWVYSDAKDRRHKDPGSWVPVIIVIGILGVIIWLFRRPARQAAAST